MKRILSNMPDLPAWVPPLDNYYKEIEMNDQLRELRVAVGWTNEEHQATEIKSFIDQHRPERVRELAEELPERHKKTVLEALSNKEGVGGDTEPMPD